MSIALRSTPVTGFAGSVITLSLRLAEAARKYLAYRRTYAELSALSTDSLLDLDLYRGDLKSVARRAAYAN